MEGVYIGVLRRFTDFGKGKGVGWRLHGWDRRGGEQAYVGGRL